MDYDRATQDFQKILDKHPDEPAAVNHLLTAVLMHELYRMGAMNTGEYANDKFIGQSHRTADPKVKEEIQQLIARAEGLEERQLKANANSVDALYARGVTRAQFAVYTAVERAWFSALRNAVGARHDHERVLELEPGYLDATGRRHAQLRDGQSSVEREGRCRPGWPERIERKRLPPQNPKTPKPQNPKTPYCIL